MNLWERWRASLERLEREQHRKTVRDVTKMLLEDPDLPFKASAEFAKSQARSKRSQAENPHLWEWGGWYKEKKRFGPR